MNVRAETESRVRHHYPRAGGETALYSRGESGV
jgi:hypothetical protein